jgi:hypothetical protein
MSTEQIVKNLGANYAMEKPINFSSILDKMEKVNDDLIKNKFSTIILK